MKKTFINDVKSYIHRAIAHLVAVVLRKGAVYYPDNFRLWESKGYHITPVDFYYPVPDTRELMKNHPRPNRTVPGIDFRPEFQHQFLTEIAPQFAHEYNAFPLTKPTPHKSGILPDNTFYIENDAFVGIDPHAYHVMIRHFKPRTIIEVGAGNSTLLGSQASRLNKHTRYISIDPYYTYTTSCPSHSKERSCGGIVESIQHNVEDLPINFFKQLQKNDILFIDSSHVIRASGDVCFLILEILPILEKGVIIHLHDIYLPFDYSKNLLVNIHYFWTEQYLLQAYLINNPTVEVMFGSKFVLDRYRDDVKRTFPNIRDYDGSASFWIRKC